MLALYHVAWIGLLWLLHKRPTRTMAAIVLILGALPRVFIAVVQFVSAWQLNAWGWAYLSAFETLTLLWLVYLSSMAWGRPLDKLLYPMLVLAAVEFVSPAAAISARLTLTPQIAVQLLYCAAQFAFLRARVHETLPPPSQWSRL